MLFFNVFIRFPKELLWGGFFVGVLKQIQVLFQEDDTPILGYFEQKSLLMFVFKRCRLVSCFNGL